MVTKLAELAIVVSLITLSQRLTGYENKPLGYALLVIAIVAALYWIYELFGDIAQRKHSSGDGVVDQKKIGRFRKIATSIVGAALVCLVAYPWIIPSRASTAPVTPTPAKTDGSLGNPPVAANADPSQSTASKKSNAGAKNTKKGDDTHPSPPGAVIAPFGIAIGAGSIVTGNPTVINSPVIDRPDRRLPPEIKQEMIRVLTPLPRSKVRLGAVVGTSEPLRFAEDFYEVFETLHWEIDEGRILPKMMFKSWTGAQLRLSVPEAEGKQGGQEVKVTGTANVLMQLLRWVFAQLKFELADGASTEPLGATVAALDIGPQH